MVYIIAEAGVDHRGSLPRAKRLLDAAFQAKADCFKIQWHKGDLMGPKKVLPWLKTEEVKELKDSCEALDMDFLVTPHDLWSLNQLMKMGQQFIKVGSGDRHLLTEHIIPYGCSVIVSLGMAQIEEVLDIIKLIQPGDAILHCISEYPTKPENAQLAFIPKLRQWTPVGVKVGYSDHCPGMEASLAAVALGAEVVEKHLVMKRNQMGFQDTYVGLGPRDFITFVNCARRVEQMVRPGDPYRRITDGERETERWVTARNSKTEE